MNLADELACAKDAALEAGKRIMEFHGDAGYSLKNDRTEVTKADIASNEIISSRLSQFGYGIISEEGSAIGNAAVKKRLAADAGSEKRRIADPLGSAASGEKFWIVDPLDGTKDFISGGDDFAVMIGLVSNSLPVLGVVYLPARKTLFYAEKGAGAFAQGQGKGEARRLASSATSDLQGFRLIASKHHFSEKDAAFQKLFPAAPFSRRGSIGVKLCEIACANADLYWNFDGLSIWDACAPQAILEEAGGEVFDLDGNPLSYPPTKINKAKQAKNPPTRFNRGIFATNGRCKESILKLANSFLAKNMG